MIALYTLISHLQPVTVSLYNTRQRKQCELGSLCHFTSVVNSGLHSVTVITSFSPVSTHLQRRNKGPITYELF